MEKHLVRVGNSLGLVIDRAICRLLGLTTNTPLEITTDGLRILIEPLKPRPRKLEQLDLQLVMHELAFRWDMPNEMHQQINPGLGPRGCVRALGWAKHVESPPSAQDALYSARYRLVLERKRAGDRWETAVDAALAQFPDPTAGETAARGAPPA